MVKSCVFFAVRTEFLNNVLSSFKESMVVVRNTYRNDEMTDVTWARGCNRHVDFIPHSAARYSLYVHFAHRIQWNNYQSFTITPLITAEWQNVAELSSNCLTSCYNLYLYSFPLFVQYVELADLQSHCIYGPTDCIKYTEISFLLVIIHKSCCEFLFTFKFRVSLRCKLPR
jgi:hypothetical protein